MGYGAHDLYGISRDERSWSFDTEKDKAPALVRFTDKPQSGVGNGRPNSHLRVADLTNNWCPATKAMTHYRSRSSVGAEAWNGCPNVITSRNLCLVIRRPRCNPGRIAPEWFLHPVVKNPQWSVGSPEPMFPGESDLFSGQIRVFFGQNRVQILITP